MRLGADVIVIHKVAELPMIALARFIPELLFGLSDYPQG
jgi:hypothetical protein